MVRCGAWERFLTGRSLCGSWGSPGKLCYEAGSDGLHIVLATDATGSAVRSNSAVVGAGEGGDQVKTDRRDAEKLARGYRAGELTPA